MNNTTVILSNAGKRFNREWIFRKLSYTFSNGEAYAITGHNGSGKSTLLQCIAGSMGLNEGNMQVQLSGKDIAPEALYQQVAICAPYLELIEEMTATEFLEFHRKFKPLLNQISISDILKIIGLEKAAGKQIRHYSSGMKQRIKLAQAIFSESPVLLLDEPCTNLDQEGYRLYHELIRNYCNNKLLIICSNEESEIDFCNKRLNIVDYK
ncbi:MAG: ABC transporter ATP-binding protein [Sediminibacterium sp.]|nr:ABC transporter ATP-binding protein [Sediminibacterium sp.]